MRRLRLVFLSLCLLASLVTTLGSSSPAAGDSFGGWQYTPSVGVRDGLVLSDVSYNGTKILERISLPVMNVFYERNVCGPYTDLLGGSLRAGPFASTFTVDGVGWRSIGITDQIGQYEITMMYYMSENGEFDAHVFSRGLQCNRFHEHLPFWRMDFDLAGSQNDEIYRATGPSTFVREGTEFSSTANSAYQHGWEVRDSVTGDVVTIAFDDGSFPVPGTVVPESNYVNNRVFGLNYSSSETNWSGGARRSSLPTGYLNGQAINDAVLWYEGYMPHSAAEGSSLWHSTGIRLVVNPNTPEPPEPFEDQVFSERFGSPNPSSGWSYQWNENGAIGDSSGYSPLSWNGSSFDSDGVPGNAPSDNFAYGRVESWGVHPGLAAGQNASAVDRYAILSYTTDRAGPFSITDSSFSNRGCGSGGVEVSVLVNDTVVGSFERYRSGEFDLNLGTLASGDVINVAVGPGAVDTCDGFDLDYTITDSAVDPPGPGTEPFFDQVFSEGLTPSNPSRQWSYRWNATGPLGDPASYSPLQWNGAQFDSDGVLGGQSGDDFAYGLVAEWGVHPGLAAGQGASTEDRYAIIGYLVDRAGPYSIVSSTLSNVGCASGGIDVVVLVNNGIVTNRPGLTNGSFDTPLGELAVGDVIDVAVGPGSNSTCDAVDFDFTVTDTLIDPPPPDPFVDQVFSQNVTSSNPSGQWSFWWNENSSIGDSSGYSPLVWNTFHYDSDGQVGGQSGDEFGYGLVAPWGVHPGFATGQAGAAADRYAVIRFEIGQAGAYHIADSSFADIGCASSDGVDVMVLVNGVAALTLNNAGSGNFDAALGSLQIGDTIDIAVGPGSVNVCDATALDLTIAAG